MFDFIRKIALAFLFFGSFQFAAYGSGGMPDDLKKQILLLAADDPETNPGDLRLVCKPWKGLIDSFLRGKEGNRWYKEQHSIWQKIVGVANCGLEQGELYKTFANAQLIYRPGGDQNEEVMSFSDLKHPFRGKFDLSKCGDRAKYLEMGTDPWWFFEKGEAKTRILFVTKAVLVRYVNSLKADSDELRELKKILETRLRNWNKEIAPVVILWRWGADKAKWFDCLATGGAAEISGMVWRWSWLVVAARHGRGGRGELSCRCFSCSFLISN